VERIILLEEEMPFSPSHLPVHSRGRPRPNPSNRSFPRGRPGRGHERLSRKP
jgi:hypothetical protein